MVWRCNIEFALDTYLGSEFIARCEKNMLTAVIIRFLEMITVRLKKQLMS